MSSSSNVGSKPPVLIDLSPQSLIDFLLSFELFFLTKNITDDRRKIATLGLSLSGSVELSAWWNGSRAEHLNKSWETFVKEFKREAFPRDYVWETEREIRNSRQKEKNYGEWSARLRNLQQTIGSVVLTDREFIKTLLYNMDEELSVFLRQHPILTNTGLHEDDLTSLGLAMVHHRVATGGHRETGLIRSTRFEIDHDGHSIPIDHKPLSIDDPNHRSDYPIEHVRGTHRQRAVVPLGHVWMHQVPTLLATSLSSYLPPPHLQVSSQRPQLVQTRRRHSHSPRFRSVLKLVLSLPRHFDYDHHLFCPGLGHASLVHGGGTHRRGEGACLVFGRLRVRPTLRPLPT